MTTRTRLTPFVAAILAVGGAGIAAPTSAQAATSCRTAWGTADKGVNMKTEKAGGAVLGQRFGHHACYDRIVLDVKGPVGSVVAGYVKSATAGSVLAVGVRHDSPKDLPLSSKLLVTGQPTVKAAAMIATTKEAQVGTYLVKAKLPFRVQTLKGPGSTNRIVIDVAHR